MQNFKFLNDNNKDEFLTPTMEEIDRALEIGRRAYLEGHNIEYNPFIRQELYMAFDEGWELEEGYERLNQLNRQFYSQNNGL